MEAAGDGLLRSPEVRTPKPTAEETKTDADDFSPFPPLADSDSDPDDSALPSPHSAVPTDSRYLTPHDLLSLPPLPPRPSSRQSADPPSPFTSVRHRTNIYIDAADEQPAEVFTTAFSPDSRYLAAGCGDGTVRVYTASGKLRWRFNPAVAEALPVTCVRFRPAAASAFSSLQNVLMATSADGTVQHYHLSSNASRPTSTLRSGAGNQLFAAAYDAAALTFAVAGRDATIRVYDEQTRQLSATLLPLSAASSSTSGHSNRIYALRFHPSAPVLFSAGWDNTLLAWDMRTRHTTTTLYGPHICGDALDVHPDGRRVLAGSWRQSGAVQVWDWAQGRVVEGVEYNAGSEAGGGGKAEMVYAAAWGGVKGQWMAAGGCGSNDAKLRKADGGRWEERVSLKGGVYSVSFSPDGNKLAVAGADANMIVVDL